MSKKKSSLPGGLAASVLDSKASDRFELKHQLKTAKHDLI